MTSTNLSLTSYARLSTGVSGLMEPVDSTNNSRLLISPICIIGSKTAAARALQILLCSRCKDVIRPPPASAGCTHRNCPAFHGRDRCEELLD